MKYYIHIGCRAGSRTARRVDEDLFEKLKDTINGCSEYVNVSELWFDYCDEDDNCEELRRYWVGDRVFCRVADENDETICLDPYIELKQMPDSDSKRGHRYGDGLWFERVSTFKGAGWIFSLELDNEEFDPNKLYFKKSNYIEEDLNEYIDALSYEGGELTLEGYDDYSFFEEQYWDELLIAIIGDKLVEIDFDVEEFEKVKVLVTGNLNEQTKNELLSSLGVCDVISEEEKPFIEGERPTSLEDCCMFIEGLAKVKKNGKWGFIDKTGKVVVPCE